MARAAELRINIADMPVVKAAILAAYEQGLAEGGAEALRTAANSFDTADEAVEVALGGSAYVVAELRRDADALTKPPDGPVR